MSEYTLYTKDGCGYCVHAKNLLKSKGFTYQEINIPRQASRDDVQLKVTEAGSNVAVRSVPQIFHGDDYIGGFTELQKYLA